MMKEIILDLCGGDNEAPDLIRGAVKAMQDDDSFFVTFVGPKKQIDATLAPVSQLLDRINIIDCNSVLTNDDNPLLAVHGGEEYSIKMAFTRLLENRDNACLITCGSTGATLVSSLVRLGLKGNATKPVLASLLPRFDGGWHCLLDCGANLEPSAEDMMNFAILGNECIKNAFHIEAPKVALVSVGKEKGKGTALVKQVYDALEASPLNFVGNVEPDDLFMGDADVVVCDGFVGNMLLKNSEAMGKYVFDLCRQVSEHLIDKPTHDKLADLRKMFSFNEYGAAVVLGVNGTVLKAHGKANRRTIDSCIKQGLMLINNEGKMGDYTS